MRPAELLFECVKSTLLRARMVAPEAIEGVRAELQREFSKALLRSVMVEPPEKVAVLLGQVCSWCACNAVRARMGEQARCMCCGGQSFQPMPGGPAE